jgi:HD-like signal output (HDOD) protein
MTIDIAQLAFPQVSQEGLRALSIIANEEPDIAELQRVIAKDPVLAGMLVRNANSPLYRRSRTITNVPAAIRVLGFKSIRNAVVMATLNAQSVSSQAGRPIWEHSLATALAARVIAERIEPQATDDLEFLGLIHDTGMLVFANNFPEQYPSLLEQASAEHRSVNELELETFGLQHGNIMARFLEQFRLPPRLIDLLVNFHSHTSLDHLNATDRRHLLILDLCHYLLASGEAGRHSPYPETIVESLDLLQDQLDIDDRLLSELQKAIDHHITT